MLVVVVGLAVLVLVIVAVIFLSVRSMPTGIDGSGVRAARREPGGWDAAERDSAPRRPLSTGRPDGVPARPPARPAPPARRPVTEPASRSRGYQLDEDADGRAPGEWDRVPDEQYWDELAADKPVATTARSAPDTAATTGSHDTEPGVHSGRPASGRDLSWTAAPAAAAWAVDEPQGSWRAEEAPTAWSAPDSPTATWQAQPPSMPDRAAREAARAGWADRDATRPAWNTGDPLAGPAGQATDWYRAGQATDWYSAPLRAGENYPAGEPGGQGWGYADGPSSVQHGGYGWNSAGTGHRDWTDEPGGGWQDTAEPGWPQPGPGYGQASDHFADAPQGHRQRDRYGPGSGSRY